MLAASGRDISSGGNWGKDIKFLSSQILIVLKWYENGYSLMFAQQSPSVCLNTSEVIPMVSTEQPGLLTSFSSDPLSASPTQVLCPDLEQAWMELLSLPELQVCDVESIVVVEVVWHLFEKLSNNASITSSSSSSSVLREQIHFCSCYENGVSLVLALLGLLIELCGWVFEIWCNLHEKGVHV